MINHKLNILAQVTLSIAGSDCCSGAGIQADLKTFSTFGVHGLTAVTAVVAETPHSVTSVYPISTQSVAEQISCMAESYPIGAIKTGMLYSPEMVSTVCEQLKKSPLSLAHLVVDPVLASTTGDALSTHDIIDAYKKELLPLATIVTPNIPEAEALLDRKLHTAADFQAAASEIAQRYDIACLLKGGHADGEDCIDYLATGEKIQEFSAKRLKISQSHGSGCTLSAAITANLAKGHMLPTAVNNAKAWLHNALRNSLHWRLEETDTFCINQSEI